jgi:CubicO group peptidase (beta-lactamase class C family)
MIERGEVTLEEPVGKLLPNTIKVPGHEGRPITLLDLVTHTSALPRLPRNLAPANLNDPYADYTRDEMFEFLSSYKLRRPPGERSVYSNYGMALLGEALALRAKCDYASLLHERICAPLGMTDTRIELDAATANRLAPGHDADGQLLPNWNLGVFAAAGGIRSTARDMIRFVQANLYLPDGATTPGTPTSGLPEVPESLRRALTLSQTARHKVDSPPGEIALAWMIQADGHTVWHNGQTGGYHSFTAFDRSRGIGVVVLANTAGGAGDDLGFRLMKLLSGENPDPLKTRKVALVDPAALENYAGKYDVKTELGGGAPMVITCENGRLWAKLSVQPTLGIYPESETEFFYKAVDAQISFTKDAAGTVTGLVLHQNGKHYNGARVEEE